MAFKRKLANPQRADDAKRQLMSWNMSDILSENVSNYSLNNLVVGDDDPSVLFVHGEEAEQVGSQHARHSNASPVVESQEIISTDAQLRHLIDECKFYVGIRCRGFVDKSGR